MRTIIGILLCLTFTLGVTQTCSATQVSNEKVALIDYDTDVGIDCDATHIVSIDEACVAIFDEVCIYSTSDSIANTRISDEVMLVEKPDIYTIFKVAWNIDNRTLRNLSKLKAFDNDTYRRARDGLCVS